MTEETHSSPANQVSNNASQSGDIAPSITAVGVVQDDGFEWYEWPKEVAHGGTGLHIPASNGNSGSHNSHTGINR